MCVVQGYFSDKDLRVLLGQGSIGGLDAVRRVALLHLDDDDDDDDDKDGQEDATQDDLHLKVLAPIPGRNTNE